MHTKVSKWGNSLGIRIPKAFIDNIGLENGSEVRLSLEGGRLIVQPVGASYGLDELADGITADNRHEESDWGSRVGRESW